MVAKHAGKQLSSSTATHIYVLSIACTHHGADGVRAVELALLLVQQAVRGIAFETKLVLRAREVTGVRTVRLETSFSTEPVMNSPAPGIASGMLGETGRKTAARLVAWVANQERARTRQLRSEV